VHHAHLTPYDGCGSQWTPCTDFSPALQVCHFSRDLAWEFYLGGLGPHGMCASAGSGLQLHFLVYENAVPAKKKAQKPRLLSIPRLQK